MKMLNDVRLRYFQLQMPEEAGLAGLALAESFFATGDVEGAERLIRSVYREFQHANLNSRALEALNSLRSVLGSAGGRSRLRYVREYIEQLRVQPTLAFEPPPDR